MPLRVAHRVAGRALVACTLALLATPFAHAQSTARVSVSSAGTEGGAGSLAPSISPNGRWVAFDSSAANLVSGDSNGQTDVFVRDRQLNTTERVSVSSTGQQGTGGSSYSSISGDGRFVAFTSSAANLVPNDTNFLGDVFVRDRQAGTTVRVSVGPAGVQANDGSSGASMSADGMFIAFRSWASNLVPGDTNGESDAFVFDQSTGTTTRVNVSSGGTEGDAETGFPAISGDGRWVAFHSLASSLVAGDTPSTWDLFLHDRQSGVTIKIAPGGKATTSPSMSDDGRWIAFESGSTAVVPNDTNGASDVFVYDRLLATTTRVSLSSGGTQGNCSSDNPTISGDGRWVAFESCATTLVPGDTNGARDVFLHDRQSGTTVRASVGPGGLQGNSISHNPALDGDGAVLAFDSISSNLVAADTNGTWDAFVYAQGSGGCGITLIPTSASASALGELGIVDVTAAAGCGWSAVSNDPAWLTVTGGASGTGVGTVSYGVASNSGAARTGTIAIGGQAFSVNQAAATGTAPLPPTSLVADSISGASVTLRWSVPSSGAPATGFILEGGLAPGQVLASIPTGSAAPAFTFGAPTGSFYLRVRALSGLAQSAPSNEILVHVNVPVPPSPPANLLGLVNGSTLSLAWANTFGGGAPTGITLTVSGAVSAAVPLGLTDSFSFAGVPPGTYTFAVVATNAAGSSPPSNPVTLTFPGACAGVPQPATGFVAYAVGNTLWLRWDLPATGAAPSGYLLNVTGSYVGSVPLPVRALSAPVPPGSYTFTVTAVNTCGASAPTAPQTVVVP